jgi:hypothetical protein
MAYATAPDLRALPGMEDAALFPDDLLEQAIAWAVETVEVFTGAAWEPKPFSRRIFGRGTDEGLFLRSVVGPRTLTAATGQDGTVFDVTGWAVWPGEPVVYPDLPVSGVVHVEGTASATPAVPVDIAWAVRTLARQYVLDLHSRVPDRALSVQTDWGNVMLAQAGAPDRPTSLPDVNAVLNRRRHRPPAVA